MSLLYVWAVCSLMYGDVEPISLWGQESLQSSRKYEAWYGAAKSAGSTYQLSACVSEVLYICLCSRNSQYYYIFSVSLGKLFTLKGLEQLPC